MILALAVAAHLGRAFTQQPIVRADSNYASAGLRAVVDRASIVNRAVPRALAAYRAHVESEIAIVGHRGDGVEGAVQIEQTANEVTWWRDGSYEQRIVGYRARMLGPSVSLLSNIRFAWTVPSLYGNRISLFFGRDTTRSRDSTRNSRTPYRAVHPFANDRDKYYKFTGGDTVTRVRVNGRLVTVARVHVEPSRAPPPSVVVFSGDVDIDADRSHIVRMRGRFLSTPPSTSLRQRILATAMQAVGYVELVNAEVAEQFWLPAYQRVELQATTMFSETRGVIRIISRFRDYDVNPATAHVVASADSTEDSLGVRPHRLTWASADSLARYGGTFGNWERANGDETSRTNASDFDDIAPADRRAAGPPILRPHLRRLSELFHFDRVEGAYTGYGAELRLRDLAPGVTLRGNAGWAWEEHTVRGALEAELDRGGWQTTLRGARTLAHTNDFISVFDAGATLTALFGADDYDYVDRRLLTIGLAREIARGRSVMRVQSGWGGDRPEVRRVRASPVFGRDTFRVNRPVTSGDYWRSAVTLDWNPSVTGEFLETGLGGRAHYERGDGALRWQRLEARLTGRQNVGELTLAARLDGAITNAGAPPQQLLELGGTSSLEGYSYKSFIGDRAGLARGLVYYTLPLFRAPIRIFRYLIPGASPAPALNISAGWTDVTGATARELDAVYGAGGWLATAGTRATMTVGLRLFGGAISIGMARPLDHQAQWKGVVLIGSW
ncbi:MAG: hypothetical protein M3081_18750 [Gemmatimonadota bacterium]|nr:hypothetical protein [Gemmatimonadota bacterium]